MAQFSSVSTAVTMRAYNNPYGAIRTGEYFESTCVSSQLIRAGHIVSFDTVSATNNFRLVVAPSSGGNGGRVLNTTNVVGVALSNSTSDGSTTGLGLPGRKILVALADGINVFIGQLKGDLPNASSIVGLQRAVYWDSTRNTFQIDSTNSTASDAGVVIVGVPQESSVGDTNGQVLFKFLSTMTAPAVR